MPLRGERADRVRTFLLAFKAAAAGGGVHLAPRHDALATLEYLGLTKRNQEEILLGLSVADYSDGPVEDRTHPGELWVFGTQVKGEELYIKLKLAEAGDRKVAKCVSFHIAQRPLRYPLKGGGGDEAEG